MCELECRSQKPERVTSINININQAQELAILHKSSRITGFLLYCFVLPGHRVIEMLRYFSGSIKGFFNTMSLVDSFDRMHRAKRNMPILVIWYVSLAQPGAI